MTHAISGIPYIFLPFWILFSSGSVFRRRYLKFCCRWSRQPEASYRFPKRSKATMNVRMTFFSSKSVLPSISNLQILRLISITLPKGLLLSQNDLGCSSLPTQKVRISLTEVLQSSVFLFIGLVGFKWLFFIVRVFGCED